MNWLECCFRLVARDVMFAFSLMMSALSSEEKLIDLDESTPVFSPPPPHSPVPQSTSPQPPPSPNRPITPEQPLTPRNKKVQQEQTSGNEMRDMLLSKKGLVVIGDILGLCAKEKKPRFIRVPGDEDKSFRGYSTANELLESLHVDTKKVRI